MHRVVRTSIALLIALGAWTGDAAGEIIDRLLAVVDGRVVTESDVRRHLTLARLFGDDVPADPRTALLEVIENQLIDRQVEISPGFEVGAEAVEAYIAQSGVDATEIPMASLREAVRARIARNRFFETRFRQFIEATDAEIQAYYENLFAPEARAQGLDPIPPLAEVESAIRSNVVTEKARVEIAAWIDSLYRRSEVEIVQ